MSKTRHILILGIWASLLAVAVLVFWDRLRPAGNDKLALATIGAERPGPPPTSSQPAEQDTADLLVRLHQALRAKNPAYNGRGQFRMTAGKITVGDASRTGITDPSPLEEFPLEGLDLSENPISDLAPLRGMALSRLALEATKVTDLTPLRGMKLKGLYLNRTRVRDLSPLRGMPLELLNAYETDVEDLTPLRGMPLKFLWLNGTKVRDLLPLAQCPLVSLTLHKTAVTDLTPLAGSTTLRRLHIGDSGVTDLTPLEGMQLVRLIFTPAKIAKGIEVARGMKSIREIGLTLEKQMPPARFWELYDQGEYTTAGGGRRLGLFVHHTDADREFAYDRKSHAGKLDKALDQADANGWIIVDMKKDWKSVFPPSPK